MDDVLSPHLECPQCGWIGTQAEAIKIRHSATWQPYYCPNCFYSEQAEAVELVEAPHHE